MLELNGVSARYGVTTVLRGVSLRLPAGGIVCLLGSNGAGKTTLIKTILGLVRPVEGRITFEGQRIDGWKPNRVVGLGIGIVPEGRRIFPRMTALENLRMGAFTLRDRRRLEASLERVLALFPRLRERAGQIAGTMSGGEQAMLAIGRGLMGEPKCLLLDEPSLGLAPIVVEQIFEMIQTINARGTTVFLVEQNVRKTLAVAGHGYVLQKGEIVAEGPPDHLRQHPLIKRAYLMA